MRTFVREKKIFCGDEYLEVDIFNYTKPEADNARSGKRSKKESESTPKQIDWNEVNSRRRFLQILHSNFNENDLHVTLTYSNKNLPQTIEDAEREERNFLRRVAYACKKRGLPFKYMSIPICKYKKDGITPARIHHHIILSGGLDRDEIEDLWRKRKRKGQKKGDKIGYANADRLQPEENGLAALAEYLAKQAGGKKRWSSSQGLDKPVPEVTDQHDPRPDPQPDPDEPPPEPILQPQGVTRLSASANLVRPWSRTNDHRFSHKEVRKIAQAPPDPEYWAKRYPGYEVMGEGYGYKAVYSDSRGWALYIKLKRKRE